MRVTVLILAALSPMLSACMSILPSPAPPLPLSGPIIYSCDNGAQLQVSFVENEARIAIVGGVSMTLPNTASAAAPVYSNGRYALSGRGENASWRTPGAAATACHGR
ncbi:MAG: hypothetical protein GC206_15410 [Alphaproteobacteria bacterium]|nr:hypothetical protein [Alphaproteobacteria bacterium]